MGPDICVSLCICTAVCVSVSVCPKYDALIKLIYFYCRGVQFMWGCLGVINWSFNVS